MKKDNTLHYKFLPATSMLHTCASTGCDRITFSEFLKEIIRNHATTNTQVSCLDFLECINDTGILACGQQCEQIQCIYVHTSFNGRTIKDAVVIITIHDCNAHKLRFFKGSWDMEQADIMVWCELVADIARQEIAYLEEKLLA